MYLGGKIKRIEDGLDMRRQGKEGVKDSCSMSRFYNQLDGGGNY